MSKEHGIFTISQGAVIENLNGEVLLLKLTDGGWVIPGGHLHNNENWVDGLAREIFEETGLKNFDIDEVISVSLWKSNYGVCFRCKLLEKNHTITLSDEHTAFAWVKSICDIKHYEFHHPAIKEVVVKILAANTKQRSYTHIKKFKKEYADESYKLY